MKTRTKILILIILVNSFVIAQWQPDFRLTSNSASSFISHSNGRSIAASGDVLHMVWYDNRDFYYEIYYKRSPDNGVSWGQDIRLTNYVYDSKFPSICVSGTVLHVVWQDNRYGDYDIFYKRSTDAGINWGADIRLTNNPSTSELPSISANGSVVNIVWDDNRDGNKEIYYKRSTDGGLSWGTDTRLTFFPFTSTTPSVFVSGSLVHIVWFDNRFGSYEVFYKRSSNGGTTWGSDTQVTDNPAYSGEASMSVSNQVVHVVWTDNRDGTGQGETYYKRSTDGGLSWGTDTRLTFNSSYSWFPSLSVSGQIVHVVWEDYRDGNWEIYYKRSTNGGINWGSDTRLTNNSFASFYACVLSNSSAVHVIWNDNRDGNSEVYYKRNPTGNPVGIVEKGSELPNEFKLSQNYPNPFNPVTNIKFSIPKSGLVKLVVYDFSGKEVASLINQDLNAGSYTFDFDASHLSSGAYFYRLTADGFTDVKKMMLVK